MSKAFYYISGPISGDPNYKIKFAIADYLIRKNYESEGLEIEIFNPAFENPPEVIPTSIFSEWAKFLAFDLQRIVNRVNSAPVERIRIFRIVRLPNWQFSRGATLEFEFAKETKRFSVIDADELKGFSEALASLGLDEPNRQPVPDHLAEFKNIMDEAHVDHTNVVSCEYTPEAEQ